MEISEVENAINYLYLNKICGMDGIYPEYLKHCDEWVLSLLVVCIIGCIFNI